MKTEITLVTPQMAREWLERNVGNRNLRKTNVENFHALWKRGEWKVTHQGIAFSKDGVLRDGQHRLTFISELPHDSQVPVNVTMEMENDTFGAIDQGARRTASDVLGISAGLSAAANVFARIHNGNQNSGITIISLQPFVEWTTPAFEELITFCSATTRIWSSAPVRAAAITQMMLGVDRDFVKVQYDALVHSRFDAMSATSGGLVKQYLSGKIVSARTLDLYCRCLRAFDSRKAPVGRIQINDQSGTLTEIREFIDQEIFGANKKSPASAGDKVAKPSSNSTRKR